VQFFLNPTITPAIYGLARLPFPIGPILIVVIQSTVIPALFLLSREVGEGLGISRVSPTHLMPAGLGLLSPIWLSEIGASFFESWTAPLILWSLYLLIRYSKPERFSNYSYLIAGVGFGLASGLKLTNAPFAVAGLVIVLWLNRESLWGVFSRAGVFVFGGILGALTTAWWNVYLATEWNSPIFPFFNSIFGSTFYDQGNWRDSRWLFESPVDFALFVVEAFIGTNKTSELQFADARFLLVSLLIGLVVISSKRGGLVGPIVPLLIFFLVSLGLWAGVFAYQRYFVPGELLMGIMIWALLHVLIINRRARAVLSPGIVLLLLATITVPSWGHIAPAQNPDNPFSVKVSSNISDSPAIYLAVGQPIAYIFSHLHPASQFHGVGVSPQIDALIVERIENNSSLPIRALARAIDTELAISRLAEFGLDARKIWCVEASSAIDNYVVCGSDAENFE
jgi:MFS family permease